jgi:hypothetical protein
MYQLAVTLYPILLWGILNVWNYILPDFPCRVNIVSLITMVDHWSIVHVKCPFTRFVLLLGASRVCMFSLPGIPIDLITCT